MRIVNFTNQQILKALNGEWSKIEAPILCYPEAGDPNYLTTISASNVDMDMESLYEELQQDPILNVFKTVRTLSVKDLNDWEPDVYNADHFFKWMLDEFVNRRGFDTPAEKISDVFDQTDMELWDYLLERVKNECFAFLADNPELLSNSWGFVYGENPKKFAYDFDQKLFRVATQDDIKLSLRSQALNKLSEEEQHALELK